MSLDNQYVEYSSQIQLEYKSNLYHKYIIHRRFCGAFNRHLDFNSYWTDDSSSKSCNRWYFCRLNTYLQMIVGNEKYLQKKN